MIRPLLQRPDLPGRIRDAREIFLEKFLLIQWYNKQMSRRTRRGWISIVVVALVATAGAFTGPVLRTDAPTRLRVDIVIPARPTSLQLDPPPTPPLADIVIPARPTALQRDVVT